MQLSAPQIIGEWMDGEWYCVEWSDVSDASGYEVILDGNTNSVSIDYCYFKVEQGSTIDFKVRAVGNSENIIDSDWTSENISIPTIDYTKLGIMNASLLSLNQLKEWATANGYVYSVSKDDNFTTLSIELTDEVNSGIMAGVGRTLGGLTDGILGGTKEEVTVSNVLPSALEKYIESSNLVTAAKAQIKESAVNILRNGASEAVDYFNMDTKIHYDYIYSNDSLDGAAYLAIESLLEMYREDFKNELEKDSQKADDDTYYYNVTFYNRNVCFTVTEDETYTVYPRWVVYFWPY